MNAPSPLQAENVSVRLSGRLILDNLSLTLAPGSMNALIGANGSGKTTLIRLLAGVISPTEGTVRSGATDLCRLGRSAVARQCAYLPQHTGTDFEIRVEDVVALGRYPHIGSWGSMAKADHAIVTWAMEHVGVLELRQRTLDTLSGGERQRVFIARALAQEAPVLLLDEPLSSLDIGRQLEILALLTELHAENRTILVALHDLRAVRDFFPHTLLLSSGRMVAAGPTDGVIFGPELKRAFGVSVQLAEDVRFSLASE